MGPNNLYFNKSLRVRDCFVKSSWVLIMRRACVCVCRCVWPWSALSAMAAVTSADCLLLQPVAGLKFKKSFHW